MPRYIDKYLYKLRSLHVPESTLEELESRGTKAASEELTRLLDIVRENSEKCIAVTYDGASHTLIQYVYETRHGDMLKIKDARGVSKNVGLFGLVQTNPQILHGTQDDFFDWSTIDQVLASIGIPEDDKAQAIAHLNEWGIEEDSGHTEEVVAAKLREWWG